MDNMDNLVDHYGIDELLGNAIDKVAEAVPVIESHHDIHAIGRWMVDEGGIGERIALFVDMGKLTPQALTLTPEQVLRTALSLFQGYRGSNSTVSITADHLIVNGAHLQYPVNTHLVFDVIDYQIEQGEGQ